MSHIDIPHAREQERYLLGATMLEGGLVARYRGKLRPTDFYSDAHRELWTLLESMDDAGVPIELVTVAEEVQKRGPDLFGGLAYVAGLSDNVPSSAASEYALRQVLDTARRRALVTHARELIDAAADRGLDLDEVEARTMPPEDPRSGGGGWADLNTVGQEILDRYQDLHYRNEAMTSLGLGSGLPDLDKVLTLRRGEVVTFAGRPGMGKSALTFQIAKHLAINKGAVGGFALEMTARQLIERLACAHVGLDRESWMERPPTTDELRLLSEGVAFIASLPLFIDTSPTLNHAQIAARVRALRRRRPDLCAFIVDHIGLVSKMRADLSRQDHVAEVSASNMKTARATHTCCLQVSQLNRSCEQRTPPIPRMSDLRESGAIEQDSNAVVFVYRPSYYDSESEDDDQIIVAKQREGATGTVLCRFDGPRTRFLQKATSKEESQGAFWQHHGDNGYHDREFM